MQRGLVGSEMCIRDSINAEYMGTDRNVKIVIITVLSDLALTTNRLFFPYLKDVLEMLKAASLLSLQPITDDDPDMPAYIQNLKESIVESYTGIVFGVKESQDTSIFDPYVPDLFQFIQCLCSEEISSNMEVVKGIVGLIGDLSDLYGKKVAQFVSLPYVHHIIGILDKSTLKDHKQTANWANVSVAKALKQI
eukprot:TRINITY_DN14_c0_g1_i5.p1 TRINITY_DN14_c0_g1~~TRINITY_DN14_c0_g1_i5.p1  ORF type:complete len:193 (+),score=35.28 TRINITY_DN14_c0_g1_i5:104-682(+)